ncbi:MAG: tetratricopeptide repeat protein, partial [Planctomycetota bacterium]
MASPKNVPSLLRPTGPTDKGRKDHPGFIRPEHWIGKRRVLNKPLFIVSLILVVVAVPALVLIHRAMLLSQADGLLRLADKLTAEGKDVEAYEQLERYSKLVGTQDVDTLQKKADLLAKAKTANFKIMHTEAMVHRKILESKPTLTKNRRRLAELLLSIEQYQLAGAEARELLKKDKADPVGLRVLADSFYAAKDYQQAQNSYKQAIKVNPADIVSYARLANCFIQAGEEKQAMAVIDQMVAKNPESGEALYRRYIFRRSVAPDSNPVADLEKALELAPENLDILLQAANQSLVDAKWEQARKRYQKVLDLAPKENPNRVAAFVGIGNSYAGAQDDAKAIEAWKKGLAEVGAANYPLNLRLVETLIQIGQLEEVQARIQLLRDNLRNIFASTRRTSELVAFQQAIDLLEARYCVAKREERKAIPFLRSASQADLGNPQLTFDALQLLGNLHAQFEEWDAASDCLQRASILRPDSQATRAALGTALSESGRVDEALSAFGTLSQGDRVSPSILFTLGKLHYRKQASLDKDKQSWQQFEAVIRVCRENKILPIDVTLLDTSYLAATDQFGKAAAGLIAEEIRLLRRMAEEAITSGTRRFVGNVIAGALAPFGQTSTIAERMRNLPMYSPKNVEDTVRLSIGMAELLDSAGKSTTAEWLIDLVLKARPDDPEVVLSKASIQASQGKFELAIKTIDDALRLLDAYAQQALLRFKSKLVAKLDDADKIIDVRSKMADTEPNNVENLTRLAEELVAKGKFDEAKKRIDHLKVIEGDAGTHWRYVLASLYLASGRAGPPEDLPKASQLQEEIQARRPGWARGQLLGAMIALADNNPTRAIGFLKRTLQSGDRRVVIYRQLLSLLMAEGELREADEYMAQLKRSMMQEPGFLPIALQLNASRKQFSEAEILARRAVEARPNDVQARIWLGSV